MAFNVQYPLEMPQVAIAFKGKQGSGKSLPIEYYGDIFGKNRHFLPVTSPKHLLGEFNAHQKNALLIFADELFWSSRNDQVEGVLKTLITQPTRLIEGKGVDVITVQNYTKLMIASNKDWTAPVYVDDRRFFVLNVEDSKIGDWSYWNALLREREQGGPSALLYTLLQRDLTHFTPMAFPKTAARGEQMLETEPCLNFLYQCVLNGEWLYGDKVWYRNVLCNSMLIGLQKHYQNFKKVDAPRSVDEAKKELERFCPSGSVRKHRPRDRNNKQLAWHFELPGWELLRDHIASTTALNMAEAEQPREVERRDDDD
jgi:hypothetical protein